MDDEAPEAIRWSDGDGWQERERRWTEDGGWWCGPWVPLKGEPPFGIAQDYYLRKARALACFEPAATRAELTEFCREREQRRRREAEEQARREKQRQAREELAKETAEREQREYLAWAKQRRAEDAFWRARVAENEEIFRRTTAQAVAELAQEKPPVMRVTDVYASGPDGYELDLDALRESLHAESY